MASAAPLSPALVATWIDRTQPPKYSPQFYFRIIAKLRPDVEVSGAKVKGAVLES
jgi:hypothetical protein